MPDKNDALVKVPRKVLGRVTVNLANPERILPVKEDEVPHLLVPTEIEDLAHEYRDLKVVVDSIMPKINARVEEIKEVIHQHFKAKAKQKFGNKEYGPREEAGQEISLTTGKKFQRRCQMRGAGLLDWEELEKRIMSKYGEKEGRKLVLKVTDPPPPRARILNEQKLIDAITTGSIDKELVTACTSDGKASYQIWFVDLTKDDLAQLAKEGKCVSIDEED